jgi:hypothetical protein
MFYIADGNLHHEGLCSCHAMAFQNLRQCFDKRRKFCEFVPSDGCFDTEDALGVLENVEVGHYHEYK